MFVPGVGVFDEVLPPAGDGALVVFPVLEVDLAQGLNLLAVAFFGLLIVARLGPDLLGEIAVEIVGGEIVADVL